LVPATEASGGLPDEIVLHTERPVVSVEVVPVERVRLRTEMVQGSEQVTERVQREQIVVDQDRLPGTTRG
jgi:stress response protein YsnF